MKEQCCGSFSLGGVNKRKHSFKRRDKVTWCATFEVEAFFVFNFPLSNKNEERITEDISKNMKDQSTFKDGNTFWSRLTLKEPEKNERDKKYKVSWKGIKQKNKYLTCR